MTKGRRPLPTNLHVLNGNPSHKNLNTNEPKPKPIAPERPSWLKPEGKKVWERLAPELERLGLLTMVDGEAFAAACQSWAVYLECEAFFKAKDPKTKETHGRTYAYTNKTGATNMLPRPEVAIGQRALADYRAFCAEFGLMPASRVRLGQQPKDPGEKNDPMERLLSKRGG